MARPDLHPSQSPGSSYSFVSSKITAADSLPPTYASSADPYPPTTMTYDQPPAPNDGQVCPTYPEFYDLSGSGLHAGGFSAIYQTQGGFPHGWDHGTDDIELALPPSPPGNIRGGEGDELQDQGAWDCGAQLEAYPPMVDSTMALADPMSQYAPLEDSTGGYYESLTWPPPLTGQISPSTSQSSYQVSSPASGSGTQFARHNSCSSLPASRAAAPDLTRFNARFRPVPNQAVRPGEDHSSSAGTVSNGGINTAIGASSSAMQTTGSKRRNTQNQTITATSTTDYNAGVVSPAMTPPPMDSAAGARYQPISPNARGPSDHRPRKITTLPAAGWSAHQNQGATAAAAAVGGGGGQARRGQQIQPRPKSGPTPAPQKARNRDAANKCRAKTKLAVADLESTERAMSSEHQELSATARGLRAEVLRLKNELLSHGSCDDTLIQQYLTNQARLIGGGGGGGMHNRHQQRRHRHQRGGGHR